MIHWEYIFIAEGYLLPSTSQDFFIDIALYWSKQVHSNFLVSPIPHENELPQAEINLIHFNIKVHFI